MSLLGWLSIVSLSVILLSLMVSISCEKEFKEYEFIQATA